MWKKNHMPDHCERRYSRMEEEELERLRDEYLKMLKQIEECQSNPCKKSEINFHKNQKKEDASNKKKNFLLKHLYFASHRKSPEKEWQLIKALVEEKLQDINQQLKKQD